MPIDEEGSCSKATLTGRFMEGGGGGGRCLVLGAAAAAAAAGLVDDDDRLERSPALN